MIFLYRNLYLLFNKSPVWGFNPLLFPLKKTHTTPSKEKKKRKKNGVVRICLYRSAALQNHYFLVYIYELRMWLVNWSVNKL